MRDSEAREFVLKQFASQVKSKNKTFRLDQTACTILEREAYNRNTSVNEVIRNLIVQELGQTEILKPRKMHRISTHALQLITQSVPEQRIIEIGEQLANDSLMGDLPLEIDGNLSPKAVQETMKFLCTTFSLDYSEFSSEGKKFIIISHYINRNYSLMHVAFWKTLLTKAGAAFSYSLDNDAVVFKFD